MIKYYNTVILPACTLNDMSIGANRQLCVVRLGSYL